jgi:hypothetical protein
MELPSARELELEVLLRERESQLANLKVKLPFVDVLFQPSSLTFSSRMRFFHCDSTSRHSRAHQQQNQLLFRQQYYPS